MSIPDQTPRRFARDDRVIVGPDVARAQDRGVVYVVTRVLTVNVVITPEGGGRSVRVNPMYLLPAPEPGTAPAGPATVVAYEPPLSWGAVVRVDRAPAGRWRHPAQDLYVVIGDRAGTYRLARLGGDPQGRYLKSIPRGWLTEVPVESINRPAA